MTDNVMNVPDLSHVKAIIVIVDMQEKAIFSAAPPYEVVPARKEGMEKLSPAIVNFADKMRGGSCLIIWTKDGDMGEFFNNISPHPNDQILLKQEYQSAVSENTPFFEMLKNQMDEMDKVLPVCVCGIWANRCVRATFDDLHDMGFDVATIAELTLDVDGTLLSDNLSPSL